MEYREQTTNTVAESTSCRPVLSAEPGANTAREATTERISGSVCLRLWMCSAVVSEQQENVSLWFAFNTEDVIKLVPPFTCIYSTASTSLFMPSSLD